MKKVLKYAAILIGIVALLAAIAAAVIHFRGIPKYEVQKVNFTAESTPARLERGKKLVLTLCAGCHKDPNTGVLTGKRMLDAPTEFGAIYSQNITQDKTVGIGDWTDGELYYLLRTGIKRDGHYAPPYMAKLPHMADEDIASIIAFLRSDDPAVKANPTPDTPCVPSFLTKMLCTFVFKPLKMPTEKIMLPDTNKQIDLGKYLVHNFECFTCHSEDFKTMNVEFPEKSGGYLGGGNKPLNMEGKVMLTPNLTPDKETGIGGWSKEKFLKAVKYGAVEGQPGLRYPMMPYVYLTDAEIFAMYAYLQTIPPIKNKVVRSVY